MPRTRKGSGARAGVRVPGERLSDERGAVTAETVMVLPVLVAVALGLAWLLALVATQVRGPHGLLSFLPPVEIAARAVAVEEPS